MMLRTHFGVTSDVYSAPHYKCHRAYHGHLTEEEYRAKCMQATASPVRPPFLSYSMVFEDISVAKAGGDVPMVGQPTEFETLPEADLQTTPANNQNMVWPGESTLLKCVGFQDQRSEDPSQKKGI